MVIKVIKIFEKENLVSLNGETVELHQNKRGKLNFLIFLLQAIADSYLVVLSTIYEILSQ